MLVTFVELQDTATGETTKGASSLFFAPCAHTFCPQYSDSKLSVMYYSGKSATCSDAVDSWKKGYEKFR